MMKWKSLGVLAGVLMLATIAAGEIPTVWQGNLYDETGAGCTFQSHRFGWMKWEYPFWPGMIFEYHHDRTSWRFTAAETATIAALQVYSSTPGDKFGLYDPQLTISIQTDDGTGKPSGTMLGSHTATYPLGQQSSPGGYSGPVTAPMTVSLTAGTVYHIVTVCDSLTTYTWLPVPGEYSNVDYYFRLSASDSGQPEVNPISQLRTYDSSEDTNLLGLYYNHIAGSPYENQWVEGSHEATDEHADGNEDDGLRRPLFEMFAAYDSQTQTVSSPIANLAQGYSSDYLTAGYSKGRPVDGPEDAVGEKLVAHYPTAVPVAKSVRVFLRKDQPVTEPTPENPPAPEPDGDIVLEVRDGTNTVLATGIVPSSSIPHDHTYMWAEAVLDTDVVLNDGQTYYVTVRSPDNTQGTYRIGAHGEAANNNEIFPGKYNSYMGIEALMVEDYVNGGTTWTEIDTRDISFALAVVIPGDANGDQSVNVGDLGILGANYGQGPGETWLEADFNGDGYVNVGDLGILGAHYGEHMPEPATIGLLVIGGLAVLRRRRR